MTPEQIAALQADNAKLKADKEAADKIAADAQSKLTAFAKERRTADIKGLFAQIGRDYKDDDAQVLAFANMDQAGFDVTATLLRESAAKQKPATPGSAALFGHQATQDGKDAPTQPAANPLLADAKRRAEQFSRTHQTGHQFAS